MTIYLEQYGCEYREWGGGNFLPESLTPVLDKIAAEYGINHDLGESLECEIELDGDEVFVELEHLSDADAKEVRAAFLDEIRRANRDRADVQEQAERADRHYEAMVERKLGA